MKLYFLLGVANAGGDVVTISDKQGRIAGYFIWGKNDGKFLKFTALEGVAQENLTEAEILKSDYLDCIISVPIFSHRARTVFENTIPGELEFHDISILVGNKKVKFFLGKCLRSAAVLNKLASEYRPLTDGSLILSRPVLREKCDADFYIARDRDEPQILVVSEKFVKLCQENKLGIDFLSADQE